MTVLGLLKSGKLRNWWMMERRNPLWPLGERHTSPNQVSLVNTSTSFLKKKKFTIERRHPLFALNEEQGHSNSSLETTKQNWNCRKDPDHSWIGWMIKCERERKRIFDECCRKTTKKTFCDLVNVHVCNIGISCIHGKELLRQLAFHQEYRRRHNETNFRHIRKISVWTIWDPWSENKWLGKSYMEVLVTDWWWKSYQSSTNKGLRLFKISIASW